MRTRFSLIIPAVALAAGLAACGDSGPSKADFTAKADAACTPGNSTISTTAKPSNAAQVGTAAGTATTTIDGQVTSLRGLKLPGGKDKAQVQGIITAIAGVSAPTKALQDAAGKNDDAAMAAAAKDMQAKADAAHTSAQAYGLAQCGTQLKFGLGNLFDGVKNTVKTSYIGKAEASCRDFERRGDSVPAPGSTQASLVRYMDAVTSLMSTWMSEFKAIPAPPGDEAVVGEYLAGMDAMIAKIKEASAAAKAGNGRLFMSLSDEIDVAETGVNAKLDAYGLKACGSGA